MKPNISIAIPNWNGAAFLPECLPAVIASAEECGQAYELLVIDDASADNSAEIIRECAPKARLLINPTNIGFGETCNRAAAEATGEILILLNNDLAPKLTMIGELALPFADNPKLFGVGAKTLSWSQSHANHVNMAARIDDGHVRLLFQNSESVSPAMFLQGGSCAMRREAFVKLGGFCPMYRPGYWEDYDLSYQALKAGWTNLYNPRAVGRHVGQGSMIRAHGEERIAETRFRNRILFALLNLTDDKLLSACLRDFPRQITFGQEPRMKCRLRAARDITKLATEIAAERRRRAAVAKIPDSEILREFASWTPSE